MTHDTMDRTLLALFRLSRDTQPIDAAALGVQTGQTATRAAEVLLALERAGWVDAGRARLTLPGLARAAQLQARAGQSGQGGGQRTVPGGAALKGLAPARPRIKPPVAARAARPAPLTGQEPLLQQVAGAGISQ